MNEDEIFNALQWHPNFTDDQDLRLDHFGHIIERSNYKNKGSDYGWTVDHEGRVIGNMNGKRVIMESVR